MECDLSDFVESARRWLEARQRYRMDTIVLCLVYADALRAGPGGRPVDVAYDPLLDAELARIRRARLDRENVAARRRYAARKRAKRAR